jgi:carotenoid cleavage dioxygenase-like enzyme
VTQKHIAFFVTPLMTNVEQMKAGGVHFAWDSTQPCYMGVLHRGGDGKDVRWFTGQQLFCTHLMGAWSDGETVHVDMDGGEGNQFPFFPSVHEPFDPAKAVGRLRRFTMNMANRRAKSYEVQTAYPDISGVLARQDDRYHTVPYRYGFINGVGAESRGWVMFDHQKQTTQIWTPPADVSLAEPTFVPRKPGAPEGDGFLVGVANHAKEGGRSDLVFVDTTQIAAGPVARVKMPYRVVGQVHGFWAGSEQLPKEA